MDEFGRQEFKALRATIRERGTVRVITFLVSLSAWAGLDLALLFSAPHPLSPLLTLFVLVAGFEAIFQLHIGVERVGRYLQVAYEERRGGDGTSPAGDATGAEDRRVAGWETAAMAYGKAFPGGGSDALFSRMFLLATVTNLLPVVIWFRHLGRPLVSLAVALAHVAFALRIAMARTRAGRQRDEDLRRFREIL